MPRHKALLKKICLEMGNTENTAPVAAGDEAMSERMQQPEVATA